MKLALAEVKQSGDLSKDFFDMAISFQNSAVDITSYVLKEANIAELDTFLFPMVYLFRQASELLLKSLYFQEIHTKSDRISFITRTRHDLYSLLNEVSNLTISVDQEKKGYIWLGEFYKNISMFDRMSDSFRYPYKFQMEEAGFDKRLTVKKVFEQRREVDLIKLSKKFIYAFALIQKLVKDSNQTGNKISYSVDDVEDFVDNPCLNSEFLEEGGHYYSSSVVGDDYKPTDFNRFADAYSDCAMYLYQKHKAELEDNSNSDSSCYHAVCYLFRNAIELSLKKLSTRFLDYDTAIKLISTKKHSLLGLWEGTKTKQSGGTSIPHPEQIDFYVRLINEVDGSSSRFRYPADNDFKSYNPDPYRYHFGIHYYLLKTCFERIRFTEYFIEAALDDTEVPLRQIRM